MAGLEQYREAFRNLVAEATTRCTQLIVRSAAALLVGTCSCGIARLPGRGRMPEFRRKRETGKDRARN